MTTDPPSIVLCRWLLACEGILAWRHRDAFAALFGA